MGLIDFDLFAKPKESLKNKTILGGIVSIFSIILCLVLLLFTFFNFRKVNWENDILVDTTHKEQMVFHFDITFPALPSIGLDVIDVAGEHQMNILKSIEKIRLDYTGKPLVNQSLGEELISSNSASFSSSSDVSISNSNSNTCGSCYAATKLAPDSPFGITCCNSCDEVIEAYKKQGIPLPPLTTFEQCIPSKSLAKLLASRKDEGCRIYGFARINRIPGNIHIAPGVSFQIESVHLHDLRPFEDYKFNVSHRIDKFYFDSTESFDLLNQSSPDLIVKENLKKSLIINPLEGIIKTAPSSTGSYLYFIDDMAFIYSAKIVATDISALSGASVTTHQYSATEHSTTRPAGNLPGVFFNIDISPLIISYKERNYYTWSAFFAQIFAIIGGIYTIASLLDAFLYQAERRLAMKRELGKD